MNKFDKFSPKMKIFITFSLLPFTCIKDTVLYTISIASPKEKNLYFSSTAVR